MIRRKHGQVRPSFTSAAALLLVPGALGGGCSSPDTRPEFDVGGSEPSPLVSTAKEDPCGPLSLNVDERLWLDESTGAFVSNGPANAQYVWEAEGLYLTSEGPNAQVQCAYGGSQTLSVTVNTSNGSCTRTAQVYCKPPRCRGLSPGECPGVRHTKPSECPQTTVLIAVEKKDFCELRIGGQGGHWIGGWLLQAPHSPNDSRPHFCGYHWEGLPGNAPDTSILPDGAWQWDCPRITTHGDQAVINRNLAALGRSHLGTIAWTPSATVQAQTRIAVIDTAAGVWRDADINPHGKAVGALALDTACPDPTNCGVSVENFLGLPLYRDENSNGEPVLRRDVAHGGSFGAHGDLVRAILAAVDAAPGVHTVLNLSLAYEAELPSSLRPAREDFANRVVLEALRYARCRGALILAAAGNGPVPANPAHAAGLPARWTALRAPTVSECLSRFGIVVPGGSGATGTEPLLYAVSAIDFATQPLLTTRGAGQSVLTALGFAVVREDPSGGYTRMLTGSSMATGTISGIAAALWARASALSPDEVIRDLYDFSEPLPWIQADLHPYSASSPPFFDSVRRITRCSIANSNPDLASCEKLPQVVAALPPNTIPELVNPILVPWGPEQSRPVGLSAWNVPWVIPQPPGPPDCGTCSWRLGRGLDFSFLPSSYASTAQSVRVYANVTSTALASFGPAASSETPPSVVAEFTPEDAPFSVPLEEVSASAAELSYQVELDGLTVDGTDSVILEAEPVEDEEL
ncbi:MAG TPA: S8/S53 family peptidase [Polyangiaceae bacterium]